MNDIPLLQIQNATVVQNGKKLLDSLNLEIAEGQHTAILGPNGSGKSTLIKLLTRQYYPLVREGIISSVSIFGHERWDIFELRSMLGIVTSDLHQAFTGEDAPSGQEAVLSGFFAGLGLAPHHVVTGEMFAQAYASLELVEAGHLADKPMSQMSTGEARRVLIARALVSNPRALLLDEPTTGLDIAARRRFLEMLRQLARHEKTIILVTHHIEEIIPEIDHVVLLQGGSVFREGSKRDLLRNEPFSSLYQMPVEVIYQSGYYSAEVL